GSLLVNFAKTSLSESFPQLWLFGLGGLFIAVVLAFPAGLSGLWADYVQPYIDRLLASRKNGWSDGSVADGAPAEGGEHHACRPSTKGLPARGLRSHRLLRRLQGGQRSLPLCRGERDPRHHRPQRRRQDHRARSHLRQDKSHRRLDPVPRSGTDEDERERD